MIEHRTRENQHVHEIRAETENDEEEKDGSSGDEEGEHRRFLNGINLMRRK